MTPQCRTYLVLERAMLALDRAGDPLAEQIRDMMDRMWDTLTDEDRARLNAGAARCPHGRPLDGDCDECVPALPPCPACTRSALEAEVLRERVAALALWAEWAANELDRREAMHGISRRPPCAQHVADLTARLQPDAVAAEAARRLRCECTGQTDSTRCSDEVIRCNAGLRRLNQDGAAAEAARWVGSKDVCAPVPWHEARTETDKQDEAVCGTEKRGAAC